jgi:hypothetical protein
LISASALIAMSGLLLSSPAWAAGSGYSPGTGTLTGSSGSGPTTPTGFTDIVTTQTVQPSGGTVTATAGSTTVKVVVPSGALATPFQVVVTSGTTSDLSGLPSGAQPTLAIGIGFEQNGQKVTSTFNTPITVTITDSSITTAEQVVVYDPSTGTYVPVSQATNVANLVVTNGQVTFQVLADPYIALLAATSAAAPAPAVGGATTPVTGVPIVTEAAVGGVLVIAGLLLAMRLRRRVERRTA